jgi:probable F420-dependent oxidoreductase
VRVETALRTAPLTDLARLARFAEQVGFDGISQPEIQHDAFLSVGLMAPATQRLQLATGVAIAFARSPMIVAYLARDLQTVSHGRFALGLGTQVKGHVERRFSAAWDAPGPRLREYVLALRAIWDCWDRGTPPDFRGKYYSFTLMTPEFSPGPTRHGPIPIQTAAVNPYNIQLAGELCDGLRIHPFSTPEYIRDVIWPNLETGASRSGRSLENFEIIGGGFIATGADAATVAAEREDARRRVAFYAATRAYRPVLEHHGWSSLSGQLARLVARGRWDELTGLITDDILDTFCIAGTYDVIAQHVARRLGSLVDWIVIPFPRDAESAPQALTQAIAELRSIPARRDQARDKPRMEQ